MDNLRTYSSPPSGASSPASRIMGMGMGMGTTRSPAELAAALGLASSFSQRPFDSAYNTAACGDLIMPSARSSYLPSGLNIPRTPLPTSSPGGPFKIPSIPGTSPWNDTLYTVGAARDSMVHYRPPTPAPIDYYGHGHSHASKASARASSPPSYIPESAESAELEAYSDPGSAPASASGYFIGTGDGLDDSRITDNLEFVPDTAMSGFMRTPTPGSSYHPVCPPTPSPSGDTYDAWGSIFTWQPTHHQFTAAAGGWFRYHMYSSVPYGLPSEVRTGLVTDLILPLFLARLPDSDIRVLGTDTTNTLPMFSCPDRGLGWSQKTELKMTLPGMWFFPLENHWKTASQLGDIHAKLKPPIFQYLSQSEHQLPVPRAMMYMHPVGSHYNVRYNWKQRTKGSLTFVANIGNHTTYFLLLDKDAYQMENPRTRRPICEEPSAISGRINNSHIMCNYPMVSAYARGPIPLQPGHTMVFHSDSLQVYVVPEELAHDPLLWVTCMNTAYDTTTAELRPWSKQAFRTMAVEYHSFAGVLADPIPLKSTKVGIFPTEGACTRDTLIDMAQTIYMGAESRVRSYLDAKSSGVAATVEGEEEEEFEMPLPPPTPTPPTTPRDRGRPLGSYKVKRRRGRPPLLDGSQRPRKCGVNETITREQARQCMEQWMNAHAYERARRASGDINDVLLLTAFHICPTAVFTSTISAVEHGLRCVLDPASETPIGSILATNRPSRKDMANNIPQFLRVKMALGEAKIAEDAHKKPLDMLNMANMWTSRCLDMHASYVSLPTANRQASGAIIEGLFKPSETSAKYPSGRTVTQLHVNSDDVVYIPRQGPMGTTGPIHVGNFYMAEGMSYKGTGLVSRLFGLAELHGNDVVRNLVRSFFVYPTLNKFKDQHLAVRDFFRIFTWYPGAKDFPLRTTSPRDGEHTFLRYIFHPTVSIPYARDKVALKAYTEEYDAMGTKGVVEETPLHVEEPTEEPEGDIPVTAIEAEMMSRSDKTTATTTTTTMRDVVKAVAEKRRRERSSSIALSRKRDRDRSRERRRRSPSRSRSPVARKGRGCGKDDQRKNARVTPERSDKSGKSGKADKKKRRPSPPPPARRGRKDRDDDRYSAYDSDSSSA